MPRSLAVKALKCKPVLDHEPRKSATPGAHMNIVICSDSNDFEAIYCSAAHMSLSSKMHSYSDDGVAQAETLPCGMRSAGAPGMEASKHTHANSFPNQATIHQYPEPLESACSAPNVGDPAKLPTECVELACASSNATCCCTPAETKYAR